MGDCTCRAGATGELVIDCNALWPIWMQYVALRVELQPSALPSLPAAAAAGCRKLRFCNAVCQKKAWPWHKAECRAEQARRKAAAGEAKENPGR